jgi:DNA-binding CsgD family transcriptional regulator
VGFLAWMIYNLTMDNLNGIIKKRSTPGMLIFDMNNRLLYSNKEASNIIPDLQNMPEEIYNLCNRVKGSIDIKSGINAPNMNYYVVLQIDSGPTYSVRAFLMGRHGENKKPVYIMVLIEKIIEKHTMDFEKAKRDFRLTNRESEVLKLICEGLANKEISEKLFISEYTVKDHIKKIMRKMNVVSRNEIMAILK